MKRRDFLKTAAVGSAAVGSVAVGSVAIGGLAMPSLALAADAKVLRFVPQANLANFDPIWTSQYVVQAPFPVFWDVRKV